MKKSQEFAELSDLVESITEQLSTVIESLLSLGARTGALCSAARPLGTGVSTPGSEDGSPPESTTPSPGQEKSSGVTERVVAMARKLTLTDSLAAMERTAGRRLLRINMLIDRNATLAHENASLTESLIVVRRIAAIRQHRIGRQTQRIESLVKTSGRLRNEIGEAQDRTGGAMMRAYKAETDNRVLVDGQERQRQTIVSLQESLGNFRRRASDLWKEVVGLREERRNR